MKLWPAMLTTFVLVLPAQSSGELGEDASTDAEVRALLALAGAYEAARHRIEELIVPLHATHPQIPEEFWDEAVGSLQKDEFYASLLPIYRKSMRPEEVKALLRFGRTSEGKKALRSLFRLNVEAENARRKWCSAFLERARRRARRRGYRL